MMETKGHKADQPGLRGHSHDAEEDLMKQFVVAKVLRRHDGKPAGNLWLKSFDTRGEAAAYVAHTPVGTQHKIIDQFAKDLPNGYRWASAEETERYESIKGARVVKRTFDAQGNRYTQDEADIAVPINGGN